MKYRKKPVVIEAVQVPEEPEWVSDNINGLYEYARTLRDLLASAQLGERFHNDAANKYAEQVAHWIGKHDAQKQRAEAAESKLAAVMKLGREPSEGMMEIGGQNVTSVGPDLHIRPTKRIFTAMFAKLVEQAGVKK